MICHFLCFIIYCLTFKHMFTKASTSTMSYFSWRISGIQCKVYTVTSAWLQNIYQNRASPCLSWGETTVLCLLIPDLTAIYRDWNVISHWNEENFAHWFKLYRDLIPGDLLARHLQQSYCKTYFINDDDTKRLEIHEGGIRRTGPNAHWSQWKDEVSSGSYPAYKAPSSLELAKFYTKD